ncbi:Outer membrane protein, IML2, mitochondrial/Tetratricopeptide repeat protein 39 [Kalmanozyma brasiliensis GHG001]|uniref:Uncharacterized protein n=1 Tax=Kalmanozyma brasiliensis (strain GHG001) TaxID=1365824 RepID=V5GNN1_KALBG|nr:Outer membrane protein, IML2, mitochondrial/Tetratricopeptide repeat protein 39 [Kalmanozyma brasiliensis GHG001]EST07552.1 Outer membrane protein, IML2, mitochondrial/Tetratricopeptide repeat protein 39 [Kalmanozyma brasiliensis GHG001]
MTAAVLKMNQDQPSSRMSVSGSRRSILAGIGADISKYSGSNGAANGDNASVNGDASSFNQHPIPVSNTDALLRRRGSSVEPVSPKSSVKGRSQRSTSMASRSQGSNDDGYLAPAIPGAGTGTFGRSRTFSAASLGLKKSNSNMSQSDARSIDSRKGSSGNSFVNLMRNRSRNSSSTNLTVPDQADSSYVEKSSDSRMRRFSTASRKMSLKGLGTRSSSNSISNGFYDEPQQLSPETSQPAVYPAGAPVEGYKPVAVANVNGVNSGRSRKFSRSASSSAVPRVSTDQANGNGNRESSPVSPAADPYAKADGLLARANSRRSTSTSQPRASTQNRSRGASAPPATETTADTSASKKGFFSSTTAKVTGAAGAGGAAFAGLARRKSSRSVQEDEANGKPNGMAAAHSDQESSESEEEESSEEEQAPPKRNAQPIKGRNGAAAAAAGSSEDDDSESEEDSESSEEESSEEEQAPAKRNARPVKGRGGAAAAVVASSDDEGSDDSSDDDFQDAPLADISEGEEDEEDDHDHRGAKAGAAGAVGAVVGAGAAASHRRKKSGSAGRNVPNGDAGRSSYKPKGTAGATRRAGPPTDTSAPGQASTSSNDTRARSDLTQSVKDKAARVAKLTAADVACDSKQLHEDIQMAHKALNLFLNSRMIEAERIVEEYADSRLYYALGYALIATIKGFMTFEPADLAIAISLCKDAMTIAHLMRKPTSAVGNFGRFVRGTGQSPSALAGMNEVQRHAELVYAETMLLKAVLGIAYAGDFFAFVSEALNMRNAYGIYRSLQKYVEWTEEKNESLDEDFKSGVYLGNGLISMILGLVPGKVLKIMEVFGYTGDTAWAMKTLSKAGQWSDNPKQTKPGMPLKQEGVRRAVCDMSMLAYHLVISTFIPVTGVDIEFADKILHYNLKRFPEGVFFLYFSGRLYSTQALAEKAITQFETARDVQKEYVQLKHICVWDLSLCNMSLCKWKEAHDQFTILAEENNWSKAVYNYGRASNLYESAEGRDKRAMEEAGKIFHKVPSLTQKIAGKSIPMEKFVARKSKKFATYGRLLLPGLEFAYVYHCLSNAPRYILADEALVLVSDALAELHEVEDPSQYYSGDEYYDDLCLAHFLRGVCLKFIACPEKHSKVRPKESPIPEKEAAQQAEISFKTVLEHGHQLKLDHWLVYFAHYELGRLYAGTGRTNEAKEQLNLVLSQKNLEDRGRKGKYSLQNMVHLRANGALNGIDGSGK